MNRQLYRVAKYVEEYWRQDSNGKMVLTTKDHYFRAEAKNHDSCGHRHLTIGPAEKCCGRMAEYVRRERNLLKRIRILQKTSTKALLTKLSTEAKKVVEQGMVGMGKTSGLPRVPWNDRNG